MAKKRWKDNFYYLVYQATKEIWLHLLLGRKGGRHGDSLVKRDFYIFVC